MSDCGGTIACQDFGRFAIDFGAGQLLEMGFGAIGQQLEEFFWLLGDIRQDQM